MSVGVLTRMTQIVTATYKQTLLMNSDHKPKTRSVVSTLI